MSTNEILGTLQVQKNETQALVSMLDEPTQRRWLAEHRRLCRAQGIDPVTGLNTDPPLSLFRTLPAPAPVESPPAAPGRTE